MIFAYAPQIQPPNGHVLSLAHAGDGLKVADTPVLNLGGDLTIEAWVRPRTADLGGPFHFILSKNYGGSGYALLLVGKGDDVRLQFEARDIIAYSIPMHVLKGHWWHVAGVFESKKSMSLYLNGVQVATKQTSIAMQPSDLPLFIGTSSWDSFAGELADVRIWKSARSQNQILDFMNRVPNVRDPNLVAEWTFDSFRKGKVYDRTHHTIPARQVGDPKRIRSSNARYSRG